MMKQKATNKKAGANNAISGLRGLLVEEMKDIYNAELAITKALPVMIRNSSSQELVDALNDHLNITQRQIKKLDKLFKVLHDKPSSKQCLAMKSIISESDRSIVDTQRGVVRDAAIILSGQKVEHYEIAAYGTLYSFARTIGEDEIASVMEEILNEEKEADRMLTRIAELSINEEAAEKEETETELSPITLYKSQKEATKQIN